MPCHLGVFPIPSRLRWRRLCAHLYKPWLHRQSQLSSQAHRSAPSDPIGTCDACTSLLRLTCYVTTTPSAGGEAKRSQSVVLTRMPCCKDAIGPAEVSFFI